MGGAITVPAALSSQQWFSLTFCSFILEKHCRILLIWFDSVARWAEAVPYIGLKEVRKLLSLYWLFKRSLERIDLARKGYKCLLWDDWSSSDSLKGEKHFWDSIWVGLGCTRNFLWVECLSKEPSPSYILFLFYSSFFVVIAWDVELEWL